MNFREGEALVHAAVSPRRCRTVDSHRVFEGDRELRRLSWRELTRRTAAYHRIEPPIVLSPSSSRPKNRLPISVLSDLSQSQRELRRRFRAASDFWTQLVALHNQQTLGPRSLWGLVVEESSYTFRHYALRPDAGHKYNPGLYRKLLPKELLNRIESLYARGTSQHFPLATATAPFPYGRFCEHLEPALSFWNGLGLTIWFLAKDGYARTSVPGMPEYYRYKLEQLRELGCPVDDAIFEEFSKVRVVSQTEPGLLFSFEFDAETLSISQSRPERARARAAAQSYAELKTIYVRHLEGGQTPTLTHFGSHVATCTSRRAPIDLTI